MWDLHFQTVSLLSHSKFIESQQYFNNPKFRGLPLVLVEVTLKIKLPSIIRAWKYLVASLDTIIPVYIVSTENYRLYRENPVWRATHFHALEQQSCKICTLPETFCMFA